MTRGEGMWAAALSVACERCVNERTDLSWKNTHYVRPRCGAMRRKSCCPGRPSHWSAAHALDACSTVRHGLLLDCRLGGGRIPRRRGAHERLSHGRARRLRVWLHAGEWADARRAGAVLMLDRRHRLASSL